MAMQQKKQIQEKKQWLKTLLSSKFQKDQDLVEMVGLVFGDSAKTEIADKARGKAVTRIVEWAEKNSQLSVLTEGLFYYLNDNDLENSPLEIEDDWHMMQSDDAVTQIVTINKFEGDIKTEGDFVLGNVFNFAQDKEKQDNISVVETCPAYHNFTGRKGEMFALWTFLLNLSNNSFTNIYGPSGIGKSALAAQAWEWKWVQRRFPYRLWINCDRVNKFNEIFQDLTKSLKEPVYDIQTLVNILKDVPVLLVLDSVDFRQDLFQNQSTKFLPGLIEFLKYLRPGMRGKVVVTSWNEVRISGVRPVHLDTLLPDDAVRLFIRTWSIKSELITEDQRYEISLQCKRLEYHPQSIVLATSGNDQESIDSIWNDQWDEDMLDQQRQILDRSLLQLPFEARELLWRISLFDGTVVMRDARRIAKVPPQVVDVKNAFNQLEKRGLVQKGGRNDSYLIHYNIRSYLNTNIYPSITGEKLKKVLIEVGRCLLNAQLSKNWLLGVKYLFDAEQWDEFIAQVEQKFKVFEPNPNLFANTRKKWSRYRAYWYFAYLYYRFEESRSAFDVAKQGKCLLSPLATNQKDKLRKKSLLLRYNTVISFSTMYSEELQDEAIACLQESKNLIDSLTIDDRATLRHEVANFKLLEGLYLSSVCEPKNFEKALQLTIEAGDDFVQLGHPLYYIRAKSNEATILCNMGGRRNLNRSIKISKEILKKVEEVDDLSLIADEYVNLVYSLIEKEDFDEAEKYVAQGLGFCERNNNGQPSISTAYKVLLMNSVDVDMEKVEESRVVRARERLKLAKLFMSLGNINLSDRISLHAAWTKVYGVEALLAKDETTKNKKLKSMMDQLHLTQKLIEPSSDNQDADVLEKLLTWLKLRELL